MLSRFLTGNKESLSHPDLYASLKNFYRDHYSANKMSLVIAGNHSLDRLEEMAVRHFSDIEDKHLPQEDYSEERIFTREHSFERIFRVSPKSEARQLSLVWVMPSQLGSPNWKDKSHSYLSHIFGHEGPNSFFSWL